MANYRNALIGELARQFFYTPRPRKLEQLARICDLASSLDPAKSYPYDYICYQITRFLPEDAPHAVFDAASLRADLVALAHEVSDSLDLPVASAGEPVLTLDEVRRTYDVSLKTVRRWRAAGLMAWRYVFPDGRKLTGVRQSTLEGFIEAHPEAAGRKGAYSYIDSGTRRAILARAFELSLGEERSQEEAVGRMAREFSCPHDAVRALLRHHDETHPEAPVFAAGSQALTAEERSQLLALYRNGHQPGDLAKSYSVGRSTVERVVRELTADDILGREWDYVGCPAFEAPDAGAAILGDLLTEGPDARGVEHLLDVQEEERLFRQYNYLKFLLSKAREEMRPSQLGPAELDRIVRLHDTAAAVRNVVVLANLRLVVHLSSRHLGRGRSLDELVSDGTVSLMQAIERFDYTRGIRFSTYASWAIVKNFAKSIPHEDRIRRAARTGSEQAIEATADTREVRPARAELKGLLRSLVASLLLELAPRERDVLVARFGLNGETETLEQLGRRLSVTRERVRQIEANALRKLAARVDPALIDDLGSQES